MTMASRHKCKKNVRLHRKRMRALRYEELEQRQLLAITVDTLIDEDDGSIADGDVSLRDALVVASSGETIDFDASLDGGTILLTMGELSINRSLTVDATALDNGLTIDASGNDPTPESKIGDGSRVFRIDDGDDATDSPVVISGLRLIGGDVTRSGDESGLGGAIWTRENLTVTSSTISGNSARSGGGIFLYLWRRNGHFQHHLGKLRRRHLYIWRCNGDLQHYFGELGGVRRHSSQGRRNGHLQHHFGELPRH